MGYSPWSHRESDSKRTYKHTLMFRLDRLTACLQHSLFGLEIQLDPQQVTFYFISCTFKSPLMWLGLKKKKSCNAKDLPYIAEGSYVPPTIWDSKKFSHRIVTPEDQKNFNQFSRAVDMETESIR